MQMSIPFNNVSLDSYAFNIQEISQPRQFIRDFHHNNV